jgi:hypothetical protein
LTKNGVGYILGDFLQPHLVTLLVDFFLEVNGEISCWQKQFTGFKDDNNRNDICGNF